MLTDFLQFVARPPRFQSSGTSRLSVEIQRLSNDDDESFPAELLDFSRHGLKLHVSTPLMDGETVTIRFCDNESDFELTQAVTIKWQHECEDGTWDVGGIFFEGIGWEILGEMFLHELLTTE